MRWEYDVLDVCTENGLKEGLNELGQYGWELVQLNERKFKNPSAKCPAYITITRAIMKRPIKEE